MLVLGVAVMGAISYCVYVFRIQLGLVGPPTRQPTTSSNTGPNSGANSNMDGTQSAQSSPPIFWQLIDRPGDGFKVEMPAGVTEAQVPAYDARGGAHPIDMIESSPSPKATFAVTWAENPPVERGSGGNSEETLDRARDGALARTQTTLIGESRSKREGYLESDFSARNDSGGTLGARLILAKARLYMLIATYPSANARHDDDVNRFFNSFCIVSAGKNE